MQSSSFPTCPFCGRKVIDPATMTTASVQGVLQTAHNDCAKKGAP